MHSFPIGVMLESFKLPAAAALERAAGLELSGVQIYADNPAVTNGGGHAPREFLKRVRSYGLTVSALCGDLGHGFGDAAKNPSLIEKTARVFGMANELDTPVMTTHIGVIPSNPAHERYGVMLEAVGRLALLAEKHGLRLAIETGPETAAVLKGFLDKLGSKAAAVNLDPANLVMVTGDDPVAAVYTLKDYIAHTHAKDGRKLADKDPEIIYGLLEEEMRGGQAFEELPLGRGAVDFPNYLRALRDVGYKGFLTIERETGDNPEEDIRLATEFLRNL